MATRFRSFLLGMLVGTTSLPYHLPDESEIGNCAITFGLPLDEKWATIIIGAISELARPEMWEAGTGVLTVEEAMDTAIAIRRSVELQGCGLVDIKVGSYTGDGNNTQAITGVGFQTVFVILWMQSDTDDNRGIAMRATPDTSAMNVSFRSLDPVEYKTTIESLDADGFTVTDEAGNERMNANENNQDYTYVAFGA